MSGQFAYDSHIDWWENLNGDGTSWTMHVVAQEFHGPNRPEFRSPYPNDVDLDGDLDIVSFASGPGPSGKFLWFENTNSRGTSWTEHLIDESSAGSYQFMLGDVDQDGDQPPHGIQS